MARVHSHSPSHTRRMQTTHVPSARVMEPALRVTPLAAAAQEPSQARRNTNDCGHHSHQRLHVCAKRHAQVPVTQLSSELPRRKSEISTDAPYNVARCCTKYGHLQACQQLLSKAIIRRKVGRDVMHHHHFHAHILVKFSSSCTAADLFEHWRRILFGAGHGPQLPPVQCHVARGGMRVLSTVNKQLQASAC